MTEEHRISQLKKGDPLAYRELFDSFRNKIFNTVLGLLQNQEDAQDITQDVFVEIFQSIKDFEGSSKLSTWIYRIAVQKSLEHIRSSQRKKRSGIIFSLFGKEHLFPVATSSPFHHPGIKLENKERASILFEAISKLPANQKTAFTLHKVESLSYVEIADIMMLSISSVESLMFRAKQNLQQILSVYYEKNER